jgi:hypothetical protein
VAAHTPTNICVAETGFTRKSDSDDATFQRCATPILYRALYPALTVLRTRENRIRGSNARPVIEFSIVCLSFFKCNAQSFHHIIVKAYRLLIYLSFRSPGAIISHRHDLSLLLFVYSFSSSRWDVTFHTNRCCGTTTCQGYSPTPYKALRDNGFLLAAFADVLQSSSAIRWHSAPAHQSQRRMRPLRSIQAFDKTAIPCLKFFILSTSLGHKRRLCSRYLSTIGSHSCTTSLLDRIQINVTEVLGQR